MHRQPTHSQRFLVFLSASLLLAGGRIAAEESCDPRQSPQKRKARSAIATYPGPDQDYFGLNLQVALVDNHVSQLQGSTPPITQADRNRYCESVDEWARSLYVATEGLYRIERVDFWGFDADGPTGVPPVWAGPFQMHWYRGWAPTYQMWPSVAQHVDGAIKMSDFPIPCTGARFANSRNELIFTTYRCDADVVGVAGNHSCELTDFVDYRDVQMCVDDADNIVEGNARFWSNILNHEGGHFFFSMPDEGDQGVACFGELPRREGDACGELSAWIGDWTYTAPLDPVASNTSAMAVGMFRTDFCDDATHLHFVKMDDTDVAGGVYLQRNIEDPLDEGPPYQYNASMWSILREHQPGFDNGPVHVDGVYGTLNRDDLPAVQCFFHDDAILNDPLIVLDRSSSMDFSLPGDVSYTALEAAKQAAVHLYNLVPDGTYSGVMAYSGQSTTLVPYEPVDSSAGPIELSDVAVAPTGRTNIAQAIRAAKDRIVQVQGQQDDLTGTILLLSDGRPTAPLASTTAQRVTDTLLAAAEACSEGSPPIRIIAVAYGNSNDNFLQALTSVCDGEMRVAGGNRAAAERPLDYKESLTRAGYAARYRLEALHERGPVTAPSTVYDFLVPAGTDELEMTWLGKPEVNEIGGALACGFDDFTFELVDPTGALLDAAALSPVGPEELVYGARTARLADPLAGTWTARLQAPIDCELLQPEVIWIASIQHGSYASEVDVIQSIVPRDRTVTIEASMLYEETPLIDVAIELEVWNAGVRQLVVPVDDGTGADRIAQDGIYTASYGPLLPGQPSGALTVRGEFHSFAGISTNPAQPLDPIVPDQEFGLTLSGVVAPGDALLLDETSFVMRDCCAGGDPDCTAPACIAATVASVDLPRGATTVGATVDLGGLPLVPGRVQVGAGHRFYLSNIGATYDTDTEIGRLTFDAQIDADAPLGPTDLHIGSAGERLRAPGALRICTPDGRPEVAVTDTSVVACGMGTVSVQLTTPEAMRTCGETDGLAFAASVVALDGVPLNPPLQVPPDLLVDLPDGASEIEWAVTDLVNGLSRLVLQTVDVTIACGSGRIPADLRIDRAGGSAGFKLSWGNSCVSQDADFTVYRGPLGGLFDTHAPDTCSTAGSASHTIAASPLSEYFLVVPNNTQGREGSYGLDSSGTERPPSRTPCNNQSILACE